MRSTRRTTLLAGSAALLLSLAAVAAALPGAALSETASLATGQPRPRPSCSSQQGDTWSVDFDDPSRSGEMTICVQVDYQDQPGLVKQEKTIKATVKVDHNWSAIDKKTQVQTELNKAIQSDANKVNGQALLETSGSGDVMTASPKADSPGNFLGAKIKKVWIEDKKSKETDTISKPAQSAPALAWLTLLGDITGIADSGAAEIALRTNQGLLDLTLTASMRKMDVLLALAAGLEGQGARTWIDVESDSLFVLVDGEVIGTVGAGCSDRGLTTRCAVLAP